MRQLHKVGIDEKFVASGEYRSAEVTQKWTIHEVGQGGLLVRCEAISAKGYDLDETLLDEHHAVLRLNRETYSDGKRSNKSTYQFVDRIIFETTQFWDDASQQTEKAFDTDTDYVIQMWDAIHYSWVLWGYLVQGLRKVGVVMNATDGVVQGFVMPNRLREEVVMLGTKAYTTTVYDWQGWHIWLDPHDIPLKIEHHATQRQVHLTNYAHR